MRYLIEKDNEIKLTIKKGNTYTCASKLQTYNSRIYF